MQLNCKKPEVNAINGKRRHVSYVAANFLKLNCIYEKMFVDMITVLKYSFICNRLEILLRRAALHGL